MCIVDRYLARLQAQIDKFDFKVEAVAFEAGYFTGYICKKLSERNIFMVMGYRRFGKRNKEVPKSQYKYVCLIDSSDAAYDLHFFDLGCRLIFKIKLPKSRVNDLSLYTVTIRVNGGVDISG